MKRWMTYSARLSLAMLLLLFLSACNKPFDSGGNGPSFSPSISHLRISRTSVFCDRDFFISFSYSDPQDDIAVAYLLFISNESTTIIEEGIPWDEEEDDRLDLTRDPGKAYITWQFDCDLDAAEGEYTVKVWVEDERGHESNDLLGEITLL